MKSKFKSMLILSALSVLLAGLGIGLVYKVFTQYLFYEIYNVSETVMAAPVDWEVAAGAQYEEYFVPQSNYLKSISINVNQTATLELNDTPQDYRIQAILKDASGKKVKEAGYTVKATDVRERIYCQFSFEKWVKAGQQYQLSLVFPENQKVSVTFGGETGHPAEHVALKESENEITEAMFVRYIYGTYSKKLLVLWFMVFFVTGYWLCQGVSEYLSRSRLQEKTKVS